LAHISTGGRDTVHRQGDGEYPFFVRSQTVEKINTYSFEGEAVLTAGDGAGVGKVFHYVNGKFDFHQRVYKFSNFCGISGQFFFHYLKSNLALEVLAISAKSTVDSLRRPMLQDFPVVLPPANEQTAISDAVARETNRPDLAIGTVRGEIALLQEFRSRIIADVVTGKLDVRAAAAALPETADEFESVQELAEAEDGDMLDDAAEADIEEAA
jgi:type I restriction enzyme, S subunit